MPHQHQYTLQLDWPQFIRQHWQQRPLLIKNAFTHFCDPISADELAGLALENDIDSRLISHQQDIWQVSHGPFNDFDQLGERDWTLLVQAVNNWHQPCSALMLPFRHLPDWRLDDLMISFSVPGGGVGPHLDQYDVFIIQGMGRRRWRVGEKHPMPQYCPHPDLLQVAPFEAIIDEEMTAGDLLYIPPGFPHEGYSLEDSLNYSVGFRAPSGRELFSGFADYLIQYELGGKRYRDRQLAPRATPADILPQELDQLRQMMQELMAQPEYFHHWFGEFASQPRHELDLAPLQPPCQPEELLDALRQGESLTRLHGLRVLKIADDVFVNGERVHSSQTQALKALAGELIVTRQHLVTALDDPDFIATLTALVNQGYWYFSG